MRDKTEQKKSRKKEMKKKKFARAPKKTVRRVGKFQFRRHATSQDEETVVDSFYLL